MIIDTHCHYNLEPLSENVVKHWKKAQESGVEASIVIGTDLENSKLAIEIASNNQGLYASIGLHPEIAKKTLRNCSLVIHILKLILINQLIII